MVHTANFSFSVLEGVLAKRLIIADLRICINVITVLLVGDTAG